MAQPRFYESVEDRPRPRKPRRPSTETRHGPWLAKIAPTRPQLRVGCSRRMGTVAIAPGACAVEAEAIEVRDHELLDRRVERFDPGLGREYPELGARRIEWLAGLEATQHGQGDRLLARRQRGGRLVLERGSPPPGIEQPPSATAPP